MRQISSQVLLARSSCLGGTGLVLASLVLTLALSACNKPDDSKTPGQKLDSAIAKTEQSGAEMKAKTEESFARAGAALKDATENAASSAKVAASKAIEKMDDMAITTAITTELAKDSEIKVLKINVDTKDGAVTLNGSVPTQAVRDRAGAVARTFNGVQSVDNKLEVRAN